MKTATVVRSRCDTYPEYWTYELFDSETSEYQASEYNFDTPLHAEAAARKAGADQVRVAR